MLNSSTDRPTYVLVTGAKGQLGLELKRILEPETTLYTDVDELDITDRAAVKKFFSQHSIRACINAAAYTAVDKAETESEIAFRINAEGPQYLAEACEISRALMVHVSTDFVFDGTANSGYKPEDSVSRLSVYGQSKAEGESRVLQASSRSIVVRTSWLYSQWGSNFVKTMIRLGKERPELGVVADQVGSPTWARDLANAISCFLKGNLQPDDYGIYHYANAGQTSWHGFASAIMKLAELDCQVNPITTAQYPTPAQRPAWSVLDTSRLQARFHLDIPAWEDSLKECVTLLLNSEKNA